MCHKINYNFVSFQFRDRYHIGERCIRVKG
jgi:hypothetical protein